MYDNKPWYQSTGVVGALVVVIGALLSFLGIHISSEEVAFILRELATIFTAVGGVMALIGRLKATHGIGKPLPSVWGQGYVSSKPLLKFACEDDQFVTMLRKAMDAATQAASACAPVAATDEPKIPPAAEAAPDAPAAPEQPAPAPAPAADPVPAAPVDPAQLQPANP